MVRKRSVLKGIRFLHIPKVPNILLAACGIIVVVVTYFFIIAWNNTPKEPFIGVAIFGNPVTVVYLDRVTSRTSFLSLPSSTYADACASYGIYPISSLWRLGKMEKKGGQIFASTLGSTLGIPIKYYLGSQHENEQMIPPGDELQYIFSVFRIPQIISRNLETNMSLATYLEVARAVTNTLPTSNILDLSKTFAISPTQNTDGTTVQKINPDGADMVFRQTHELNVLREEHIRVSIINTTGVIGLSQKVARTLLHTGITVVDTGSEDKQFDTCEVTAKTQVLGSQTVTSIVSFLSCKVRTSEDTGTVDVIVRLGKKEAARF